MNNGKSDHSSAAPSWGGPLLEVDYAKLLNSWITRELADQAMLRRVASAEGAAILGRRDNGSYSGIAYPYVWPGEDRIREYWLRRDRPEIEYDTEGKPKEKNKYLGPPGRGNLLYIAPGTRPELLDDLHVPIVITEGAKKTIALHRLSWHGVESASELPRFLAVGLGGVWSFRGTIGKVNGPDGSRRDEKGLIPDLRRLALKGRTVYIVFDSNVRTNARVGAARRELTAELTRLGAEVFWVNLPTPEECSGINGVDDLLATWGPERVLELFDSAEPAISKDHSTQAEVIVRLGTEARLFHTPEGEAFAEVHTGSRREVLILRSKSFRRWLMKVAYRELGKPPGAQALQDAIGVLEAQAQFDSPEAQLFVRVAEHENRTYIDLCNANGEVVEISIEGWRVLVDPPIHFRRTRGMQPLPRPVLGGSITQLRKFLNVGDDHNWILCVSWLMAACRARGPYPILILRGEQGSAKSTMARILRMLIDPSVSMLRTTPRDERDLFITATNAWVVAYDNISRLPPWLSDALCRLANGGGFATRELYTDAEEVFLDATRPVMLNGIEHLAERADLVDRALILDLPAIEEFGRKEEDELYAELAGELPKISGALFTALSGTLALLPQTKLHRKPRMADFARWATAAEEPLGFANGAFMTAYCGNRAEAVCETLESDPVGTAIIAMMDKRFEDQETIWEGISKDLQHELEQFVDEGTKRAPEWPKTPRGLGGRLRRLATFLRESGILITFPRKGGKGRRLLAIQRLAAHQTATTATSATSSSYNSADQPDTAEDTGGDCDEKVADETTPEKQPPPAPPISSPLNGHEKKHRVAEVAKVAVDCSESVDGDSQKGGVGRTDLCSRCGRGDWEWNGSAWVCRHCGTQASGVRSLPDLERFEL